MLHAFAYSSRMSAGLSNHALRQIVLQSAAFNRRVDVTGALIVDGQRFFQYIEGPPDGMAAVRRRIQDSRSHAAVAPVLDMAIGARAVPYWAMTHIETGQIVVSGLVNARWDEFGHAIPGMDQLVGLLRPHFPRVGSVGAPRANA
ncbi:BLUF domain-containing protein [Stenotrophomonas sp. GD03958]|uniref:BLUF domain-containing protein n=1 Tax=Stenotrophomonas sp. GD03958 TaxID=2975411 RepID=UPI0007395BE3|nr:BLUF domain-containing protein [Stenotrophomonas sp. GD03958]MCM2524425.1 BLUF domain-containing protein [Stenotrophomonas maltophilia]MCU1087102.1 BLUF domain-containing protein [Stenotrophomonas maltophilia]MDH1192748.1 BLUF domain-containing protein [Stenotrophomonas sp. GD03958]CRD63644.1 putative FAD containing sensors of blue-light domain protein [Stenotrophomonas maltophilia]